MSTDSLRHSTYYISGGDLHFLVGRTRFLVHSCLIGRESIYWKNRMAGMTGAGLDENTAFLIEGIEAEDFAQFLGVFYNSRYDTYDTTSLGNWEVILRLANQWECPRIRKLAVKHIDERCSSDFCL